MAVLNQSVVSLKATTTINSPARLVDRFSFAFKYYSLCPLTTFNLNSKLRKSFISICKVQQLVLLVVLDFDTCIYVSQHLYSCLKKVAAFRTLTMSLTCNL